MLSQRDIRKLAMQILYQIDLRGPEDLAAIEQGLQNTTDSPEMCKQGMELAAAAWETHAQADALVQELAPNWPTHRQPPVDRAILRLAHYEMTSGRTPPKVAINEAIELAKQFSSEHAPAFVNGVLDKAAKRLLSPDRSTHPATGSS
jgi:N utilization substance protein B